MIKTIIIIFVSFIIFISEGVVFKNAEPECKIFSEDTINADGLRDRLLGSWNYKYSYYKDSCFILEKETSDLPFSFSYASFDYRSLNGRANKLFNLLESKENNGKGLICYHKKTWVNNSYPVIRVNKNLKIAYVNHYNGSGDGVGKTIEYKLYYIKEDTLVCSGPTGHLVERHVYLKTVK